MARLTNENLHSEIKLVKNDIEHLKDGQEKIQSDLSMIKKQLLGPDDGAIARINRNTEFRNKAQKVLWSLWIAVLGIIGKMIFWDQRKTMAKELNEDTGFNVSIKTLVAIGFAMATIISMWFMLQADINEAKELPVAPPPDVTRMEFDMKDKNIRLTIQNTQKDVEEIKDDLDRIEDKIDKLN